jgi:hypothetical protein
MNTVSVRMSGLLWYLRGSYELLFIKLEFENRNLLGDNASSGCTSCTQFNYCPTNREVDVR